VSKFRGKIMIFTHFPHQFTLRTNIYGHPLYIYIVLNVNHILTGQ
jgi:hypothetical protein